jgi:hypothetical protein
MRPILIDALLGIAWVFAVIVSPIWKRPLERVNGWIDQG